MDTDTCSSDVAMNDLAFRAIAKAIRTYLGNEYAFTLLGLGDNPPLRLSTYSGKGIGHYATAADGRADWTQAFYRYMERSLSRSAMADASLRFGFAEVQAAMERMRIAHRPWFDAVYNVDVLRMTNEDYAEKIRVEPRTVKRLRKRAAFYLYSVLRMVPQRSSRKIAFRLVEAVRLVDVA